MASVQLNMPSCTSITFTLSGVKIPVAGVITGITSAEAQNLVGAPGEWNGFRILSIVAGVVSILIPQIAGVNLISSITLAGNVYNAAGNALIINTSPIDVNNFAAPHPFLITG